MSPVSASPWMSAIFCMCRGLIHSGKPFGRRPRQRLGTMNGPFRSQSAWFSTIHSVHSGRFSLPFTTWSSLCGPGSGAVLRPLFVLRMSVYG